MSADLTPEQIDALAAAGNRAVNDAVHEDLCMCDTWPEKCLSSGGFFQGYWDTSAFATGMPAVISLWETMRNDRHAAKVSKLRAELAARPSRAEVLREAADVVGNEDTCECGGCDTCVPNKLAAELRRMAAARTTEKTTPAGAAVTPQPQPGCTCGIDPDSAHKAHAKWCPASKPTAERITEIRSGTGDELTRDELYWLSGTAGRYELHVIGARGGHWPLTDDLPGTVLLLSRYLAAAVAVIERSQPYASTRPTWEKASAPAPTATPDMGMTDAELAKAGPGTFRCRCAHWDNVHGPFCFAAGCDCGAFIALTGGAR